MDGSNERYLKMIIIRIELRFMTQGGGGPQNNRRS